MLVDRLGGWKWKGIDGLVRNEMSWVGWGGRGLEVFLKGHVNP